jgi:hypothetical protein
VLGDDRWRAADRGVRMALAAREEQQYESADERKGR